MLAATFPRSFPMKHPSLRPRPSAIIAFLALLLTLAPALRATMPGITMPPANDGKLRIIAFGAHPDDCELQLGGTAARWAAAGVVRTLAPRSAALSAVKCRGRERGGIGDTAWAMGLRAGERLLSSCDATR